MSDAVIGKLITGPANRDAIHVAVAPVIAAEPLMPGMWIGFAKEGDCELVRAYIEGVPGRESRIGIVDPFMLEHVPLGGRFWMFLIPGSIVSLRHDWTHPKFANEENPSGFRSPVLDKAASEEWLRSFCAKSDCPPYEIVIAAAVGDPVEEVGNYGRAYENDGEYLYFNGREAHSKIPNEFWGHVESVTGKKCVLRPRFFSFSC